MWSVMRHAKSNWVTRVSLPGLTDSITEKRPHNLLAKSVVLSAGRNQMAAKKGSRRKSGGRKYGKAAGKTVESAIRRKKRGTLRSGKGGKGGKVKSRKQAIAIGLSEARKKGAKVPRKKAAKNVPGQRTLTSRLRTEELLGTQGMVRHFVIFRRPR